MNVSAKIVEALKKATTNAEKIPIVTEAIKQNVKVNDVSPNVLAEAIVKAVKSGVNKSKLVEPVSQVLGTNKGPEIANKVPAEVLSKAILEAIKKGVNVKPSIAKVVGEQITEASTANKNAALAVKMNAGTGRTNAGTQTPSGRTNAGTQTTNTKEQAAQAEIKGLPNFIPSSTNRKIKGYTFIARGKRGSGYYVTSSKNKEQGLPNYVFATINKQIPGYTFAARNWRGYGFHKNTRNFISSNKWVGPKPGYVFTRGPQGQGYYRNTGPNRRPEGYYRNMGPNIGRGYYRNMGRGPNTGASITFAPRINVAGGAGGRTGAVNVRGSRMGAVNVRGGQARTGTINVRPEARTGTINVRARNGAPGVNITPQTRTVNTTTEQLVRNAGGTEKVEKALEALRTTNGNVNKARTVSQLPLSTFTNIYAMGGPVAAKKTVERIRRRRRAPAKKKRVVHKPRRKFIKLTPYQFKRLTQHIKKNNLRTVLAKEITQ